MGVAIWESAEEGIESAEIVLPVGGGEDGLSGGGRSSFPWGDDVGSDTEQAELHPLHPDEQ